MTIFNIGSFLARIPEFAACKAWQSGTVPTRPPLPNAKRMGGFPRHCPKFIGIITITIQEHWLMLLCFNLWAHCTRSPNVTGAGRRYRTTAKPKPWEHFVRPSSVSERPQETADEP